MPRNLFGANEDESSALRIFDILGRRKLLVTAIFAGVLASAVSVALYLPDLYRATSIVLVERQVSESLVRPTVSGELESRLHVIKQEILSRDRLTDLVTKYNLYPELRGRNQMEDALNEARRDIQMEASGPEQLSGRTKTVTFKLTYTGREPETVANVTNALASFYVDQNDHIRSNEATQTTEFLNAQLKDAKRRLDQQEDSIRAYTARHVGELPQQVEVNLATLERLNTQLRLNGERQIRTLEQREKLVESPADAITSKPPELDNPDERIERLKKDLQTTESRVTAKHPDVLRLKAELAALQRENSESRLNVVGPSPDGTGPAPQVRKAALQSLDAEMEKLKNEETDLRGLIAGVEKRLDGVPERQQEFTLITRDHEAAKELYDSLLKRAEEARLAESLETDRQGEVFRILEPASAPEGPSAPNRVRLVLLGVILALGAAFAGLLVAEQLDTGFHNAAELRQFTRVPVLVAIPRISSRPVARVLKTALATASILAALALVAVMSAHMAQGNEQLVRLLVRGT